MRVRGLAWAAMGSDPSCALRRRQPLWSAIGVGSASDYTSLAQMLCATNKAHVDSAERDCANNIADTDKPQLLKIVAVNFRAASY